MKIHRSRLTFDPVAFSFNYHSIVIGCLVASLDVDSYLLSQSGCVYQIQAGARFVSRQDSKENGGLNERLFSHRGIADGLGAHNNVQLPLEKSTEQLA